MVENQNKAYIDKDGILVHEYIGFQNGLDMDRIYQESEKLIANIDKPVVVLADSRKIGGYSMLARRRGAYWINHFPIRKMAVLGTGPALKYLVIFFIKALNMWEKIRLFDNEESARKWLKE